MAGFAVLDLGLTWEVEQGQDDWHSWRCWAECAVPKLGLGVGFSLRAPSVSPQGPALTAGDAE